MENQDIYNIYNLYIEGYFDSPKSYSKPPYTITKYSRDDAGRWEYGLLLGGKEIDSYIQRSRDTESDVMNYFINKHNIDRSDIEFN
jgi:hypothetical protein